MFPLGGKTGRQVGRLKLGVVLEGGGALGLAHIGVLQWFEEHRIPVSYIAGTSMENYHRGVSLVEMPPTKPPSAGSGNIAYRNTVFFKPLEASDMGQPLMRRRLQERRPVSSALLTRLCPLERNMGGRTRCTRKKRTELLSDFMVAPVMYCESRIRTF